MRQARRGDTNTNGFECYPGCSVYSIAYVKDEQWNFAPWRPNPDQTISFTFPIQT